MFAHVDSQEFRPSQDPCENHRGNVSFSAQASSSEPLEQAASEINCNKAEFHHKTSNKEIHDDEFKKLAEVKNVEDEPQTPESESQEFRNPFGVKENKDEWTKLNHEPHKFRTSKMARADAPEDVVNALGLSLSLISWSKIIRRRSRRHLLRSFERVHQ